MYEDIILGQKRNLNNRTFFHLMYEFNADCMYKNEELNLITTTTTGFNFQLIDSYAEYDLTVIVFKSHFLGFPMSRHPALMTTTATTIFICTHSC